MDQTLMVFPLAAMAFFTLFIGLKMLAARIEAVKKGEMEKHFFYLKVGKQSEKVIKFTQHYENLFETPVLFYLVMAVILALQLADTVLLYMAWAYVALRVVHAYIHTSYNNIDHRMLAFFASLIVLYGMWGRVVFELIGW